MKHEEYSWKTSDGLDIFAQSWAPDRGATAVVALVHGLGEHSGRYEQVVKMLPAAGYAVNAYDLRGHGKSGGPRLFTPSFDTLMLDIDHHLEETRARFPGMPVFLYGHSLGGEQVLYYALRRSPQLAGVIATSPLLRPGIPVSPVKVAVAKFLSLVVPTMVMVSGTPMDGLSRDPALVEKTKKDPLYQEGLSVRIGAEFLRAGKWILAQKNFPLPLLVMQGTDDHHVAPETAIGWARQLSRPVTLKIWEGGKHELHNDIEKEKVIEFMISWMAERAR